MSCFFSHFNSYLYLLLKDNSLEDYDYDDEDDIHQGNYKYLANLFFI